MDMNIKGLLGANITPQIRATEKVDRAIRSDSTQDRDANGQQAFGENQQQNRQPMSEEQFQKALAQLKNLQAVKEHNWTVTVEILAEKKYVLIKDNLGNLIRRIPELELWTMPMDEDLKKGNLLSRAA